MMERDSLRCLNCWRSPLRLVSKAVRRKRQTCQMLRSLWISRLISAAWTRIVRIQSASFQWMSFDVDSGNNSHSMRFFVNQQGMKERQSVAMWYCIVKLSHSKVAQACNQLVEYIGTPFLELNMENSLMICQKREVLSIEHYVELIFAAKLSFTSSFSPWQ